MNSRMLLLLLGLFGVSVTTLPANNPDSLRQELIKQPSSSIERARILLELGNIFSDLLERDSAILYFQQALTLGKRLDDQQVQLQCHENLARTILNQQLKLDSVEVHLQKGLNLARNLPGTTIAEANLLRIQGELRRRKGELEEAMSSLEQAGHLLETGLEGQLSDPERKHFIDRYILVLNAQGNILKNLSRCEEGIQKQREIIEWCGQTDNFTQMAYATFNMGSCYFIMGDYPQALEHYLKSPEVMKDPVRKERMASGVYLGVGGIYAEINQLDSARHYYKKALQGASDSKIARRYIGTLENLGALELKAERYDSAVYYFEQSIALAREGQRKGMLASSLAQIGAAHLYAGNDEAAAPYLTEAYKLSRELDSPTEIAYSQATLAEYHQKQGRTDQAITLAKASLTEARERQMMDIIRRASLILSQAYEAKGAHKAALAYFKEHVTLKDQLFNEDKVQEITRLKMQNQFEQERERERLEQEKKDALIAEQLQRQNIQKKAMGGGLLATGTIAALLFWGYRNKQRSHALLADKNQIIQKSLQEKEVLLKEIHHRVKNNLQVISSLLSLQSRRVEDQSVQEAILEGRNRVRSMAMIHQNLYQTEKLTTINVEEYIEQLAQNLFASYNIEPDRISMDTQIQALELDVDVLIPLGLILNELITNALKYAFPEGREGKIRVSLQRETEQLELRVKDNGIGLPDDFEPNTTKSMGYQLVNSLVRKLKGRLEVQNQVGTDILLSIPQHHTV